MKDARGCRRGAPWLALLAVVLATAAEARLLVGQDEALARVFPPPTRIQRKTLFVDEATAARIAEESGVEAGSRVVTYYVGTNDEGLVGHAYFDRHLVRTLAETIMVLVDPEGAVRRIEILSFDEPPDYLARPAWLEQFYGRKLDDELALRRGIRNLTGASLTADAVTAACRRVLAIHRVVAEGSP